MSDSPKKPNETPYFILDQAHTDPARIKRERAKARELKQTRWWKEKINHGICEYCQKRFKPTDLTMDHMLPLARGGESSKSNLVPSCHRCNQDKKLESPLDALFDQIKKST